VAHEDRRAIELVEDLLGGGHVALEGDGRVLHDCDPVTLGAKPVIDAAPSGAVDESAMDEYDGRLRGCAHCVPPWVGG